MGFPSGEQAGMWATITRLPRLEKIPQAFTNLWDDTGYKKWGPKEESFQYTWST